MQQQKKSPYEECPKYESEYFTVRLVERDDATDLLDCYSDPKSAPIFNSDNCTSDFIFKTVEEVSEAISYWIFEYEQGNYVRFSLIDRKRNKAIGTIEIFAKEKPYEGIGTAGILRLDLASQYEKTDYIEDILQLINDNFFADFDIENILTKAVPSAEVRLKALQNDRFIPSSRGTIVSYDDYFIKKRS